MTPTTAQAIIDYVKRFNVSAKPTVGEAEAVVETWLRSIGWQQDRWGNFLSPQDPKKRYHLKKTQLNKQEKNDRGDWVNVSYQPTIDASVTLIVSAAGVLGDQSLVDKYSRTKAKRKEEKQHRADDAQEKRYSKEARELALKEYAMQRRGFVQAMLQGKVKNNEMVMAREEFALLQSKWLAAVKAGELPENDQQFASADQPPVVPVYGNQPVYDKQLYVWIETVDGVDYTVRVKTADQNVAEISIGKTASGLSTSATTHVTSFSDMDDVGDAYISGKVYLTDGEIGGALFFIISNSKQKGAGSRALSIWCRMMAGYGIKLWVAQAVGEEGAAFFEALQKKGTLKVQGRRGANWIIQCTAPRANPSAPPEITTAIAKAVGEAIGVDWKKSDFDVEQFRRGMVVELEHGDRREFPLTNVTNDDLVATGAIALAHLIELPDYYYRLADMERDGERAKKAPRQKTRATVKPYAYHGRDGFLVYGVGADGKGFSIFADDQKTAEKIRVEYKESKPGWHWRVSDILLARPSPNPAPIELQAAAKKAQKQWGKYGVHVGTGYALALGDKQARWSIFAWADDLQKAKANLPEEFDGYPVQVRGKVRALSAAAANPSAPFLKPSKYRIRNVGEIGGWPVWVVNGGVIRERHQEFVIGGNHGVYKWVPKDDLLVEESKAAKPTDTAANAYHEAFEYRLMLGGMEYGDAHEKAEAAERRFRKKMREMKQKLTLSKALALAEDEFQATGARAKLNPTSSLDDAVLAAMKGLGPGTQLRAIVDAVDFAGKVPSSKEVAQALRRLQDRGLAYSHDPHGTLTCWGGIPPQQGKYWSTRESLKATHGYGDDEMPVKVK